MDVQARLRILADAAKYDVSCASSGSNRKRPDDGLGNGAPVGICHSYTPDGRCVSLLKILLTNYCIYDCTYCVNRISSDTPRARFTPEEVATLTVEFYKRNYIEGLFLSSGVVGSADATMELLIRAARILREQHRFGGYVHLKAVPGASQELLAEAGQWADRLSANIELPTQADLDKLAPAKSHAEITTSMEQIRDSILDARDLGKASYARAGQSTQMVIGATATPDAEVLTTSASLYRTYKLRRVYYSGFSPIPHSDPRLPVDRAPLVREHRLYQADWLMRFYGFSLEDVTEEQNLPLDIDPKLAWALRHREFFPVDVNRASKYALLRVPGFGVRNVQRILQSRRYRSLTLHDLRRLNVPVNRARYFVTTGDANDGVRNLDSLRLPHMVPTQIDLFGASVRGEF
ncbi:MAG TPA: putative DNA modification/repair radical SAM protein [Bryobacteraceae bacterium]|nr:putative DNA modification/repair radical SAM protein [Bryobacteraceae bacterium]